MSSKDTTIKRVYDLLSDPFKKYTKTQDVLTCLFRRILLDQRYTPAVWGYQHEKFFNRFDDPEDAKRKDRGNLNKRLTSDTMTWEALRTGIVFLDPHQAIFTIDLTFQDGHQRSYDVHINPKEIHDDETIVTEHPVNEDGLLSLDDGNKLSIFTRLFRQIVRDERIDEVRWNELLETYVRSPGVRIPESESSFAKQRMNKDNAFRSKRMAFPAFRSGLLFLQAVEVTYSLKLEWSPNRWKIAKARTVTPIFSSDDD